MKSSQGYIMIALIMVLMSLSMILLHYFDRRISSNLYQISTEREYLQAFHQAQSSLQWAKKLSWPLPTKDWQCYDQTSFQLFACIKLSQRNTLLLLKGEGEATKKTKITLYHYVLLPDNWHSLQQLELLNFHPKGWLDYCPESQEKFCQ